MEIVKSKYAANSKSICNQNQITKGFDIAALICKVEKQERATANTVG
jgi:hypothetical protein